MIPECTTPLLADKMIENIISLQSEEQQHRVVMTVMKISLNGNFAEINCFEPNWNEGKPIQLVCEIHTKLKRTWLFKIY